MYFAVLEYDGAGAINVHGRIEIQSRLLLFVDRSDHRNAIALRRFPNGGDGTTRVRFGQVVIRRILILREEYRVEEFGQNNQLSALCGRLVNVSTRLPDILLIVVRTTHLY